MTPPPSTTTEEPGLISRQIDAVQAAAKWFAECAMRRFEVGWQQEGLLLRQGDIFGKAAIAMDADGAEIARRD